MLVGGGLRYSAHVKNKLMYLIFDIADIQMKYLTTGLSAGCHGVVLPPSSMINHPQSRADQNIIMDCAGADDEAWPGRADL